MPMEHAHPEAIPLDQLPTMRSGTVSDMAVPSGPLERRLVLRLLELGFVPGERVRVVHAGAPGHEPIAVRVGHATFALRRHEAAFIRVVPA